MVGPYDQQIVVENGAYVVRLAGQEGIAAVTGDG